MLLVDLDVIEAYRCQTSNEVCALKAAFDNCGKGVRLTSSSTLLTAFSTFIRQTNRLCFYRFSFFLASLNH